MSVPILDRQQTPGSGGGLPAVSVAAAVAADDVAAGQSGTQQATGAAASSCGQMMINLSTQSAPPSSSLTTRQEASQPPQSRMSSSCIGTTLAATAKENTRSPFDDGLRQQEQERRPNDCDKNKQRDDSDAQAICTNQTLDSQRDLGGARQQTNHEEGARSTTTTSGANPQLRFKLPNPTQEAPTLPGQASAEQQPEQINISGSATAPTVGGGTNIKPLVVTRHHSTIEMSDTPIANRMLKRKTSVFSHSGFMGLHKLDQSAIQQHVIVSSAATATAVATTGNMDDAVALQQQVDKSKTDQSSSSSCKTTTVAASSPRQPYRSDTLGSTGSSRASSCDEPTIVSPAKLSAPTSLIAQENHANKNLTTIPSTQNSNGNAATSVAVSSLDSLAKRIVAEGKAGQQDNCADDAKPTMMQCDNENDDHDHEMNAHERGAKQTYSRKCQRQDDTSDEEEEEEEEEEDDDEEDDEDEDEVDDENKNNSSCERPQRVSLSTNFRESLKMPPFESIKTQIKKNSIPNTEDIKRHIDKLISRNEEIIDNWNQVSIRSYNSSGATAASATTSAANKRPSKRWSTTALCTKGNSIVLNQPGDLNGTSPGKPMSGIERKRSQIHQHPVRRVSQQHKPLTIFNEPQTHQANTCSQKQQHLIVQTTTGSVYCPSQVSLSMPSSPKQIVNPFLDARHQTTNYQNHALNPAQQTIESAIENLSLKKRQDDQIDHSIAATAAAATNNRDDFVMAALLVERQRQQQLLDEYLRQQAASSDHHQMLSFPQQSQPQIPTLPNPILDHYQQQHQQQQQLIEHQLGLSRLAALESELMQQRQQQQQAVASLMNAATLQNQQSLAAAASSTLAQADQFTQQAALENHLLNEYLAKMILSRQQDHQQQQQQQQQQQYKPQPLELATKSRGAARSSPGGGGGGGGDQHNGARPVGPFQVSPTSPSRVYLGHGSELQTQSLDSATPSYRCDACDISFWTRDLLNYHSMTSCSARTGPRPSKPIAFSFNQPNGYDSTTATMTAASSLAALQARQSSGAMQSPLVVVSCADTGQPVITSSAATATSHAHSQQKQVGPARRRTYDELNAPSSPYMATYRDLLIRNNNHNHHHQQQQQQPPHPHQMQISTSSIDYRQQPLQNQRQLSPLGSSKSVLVAPKSPHKTRESAELAWQQRLEELSILKQQLLLNASLGPPPSSGLVAGLGENQQRALHVQQVTLSGNENQESKLPIKKRKISEPNMKY